ncbi:MAG: SDR family oxidoreductase [Lachnospiraceae bacterium]|nr:SDR family oxidoreductase [Lachnospiraceae bacterium]
MKTYLITGASGGIGSGIAKKLASEGCRLVLCGNKNSTALTETVQSLGEDAVVKTFLGDLSNEAFVNRMVQESLREFGKIDGIVHAAGIASLGLMTDLSLTDWNDIFGANLTSAFLLSKALAPHFILRKEGKIILLSSVWGGRGASCEVAYSATKGGIDSFTKALAKELAPSGIAVNALAPGMVDTPMNGMLSEEEKEQIIDEIPACRMTTPEEVAEMVSLLLKAPSYLTGQVIGFNGGWY